MQPQRHIKRIFSLLTERNSVYFEGGALPLPPPDGLPVVLGKLAIGKPPPPLPPPLLPPFPPLLLVFAEPAPLLLLLPLLMVLSLRLGSPDGIPLTLAPASR